LGEVKPLPAPEIRAPEKLGRDHDLTTFRSREVTLNDWLRRHAIKNEGRFSRTYVVCQGNQVIGYYALANGAVQHVIATRPLRRNAPDPVPVMVLGRLATDERWEGRGIGKGMLRDAILRTIEASEIAGIAAILVHAISAEAKAFYEKYEFRPSELEEMTLMITLAEAKAALG
jgi:predicted N-acetyltransferase YhbS